MIWRHLQRLIEGTILVAIVLWLFFTSDTLLTLWMTGGAQIEITDTQKQIIQNITKIFLALSGYLLIFNFREILEIFVKNPFYLVIILLSWMSLFWSIDPDITLRRCMILTSFSIIAAFVALRYDIETIVKIFLVVSIAGIALSIYCIIFQPALGINFDGRGARGAFVHKNIFGVFLLASLVTALTAIKLDLLPRWISLAYLATCLVLLILSNSATAWLAAIIMLGIYALTELGRLSSKVFAMLIAFGAAIGCFAVPLGVVYFEDMFLAIDRDPTLTGRDAVWTYATTMIQERLLLGHGYAAFWESEPILSYVTETLKWHITHAHNGYLQVWLELGLIGLGCLLLHIVHCLARFAISRPSPERRTFVLTALVGFLVYNTAETQLLLAKNFGWIILMICLFMTTPGLERLRQRYARPSI